jgi:heme exporter protein D
MSAAPRPPPPDSSPAATDVGYEFVDANKESFRALAASMSFVGVCTMLFASLASIFSVGELYAGFVWGAVGMVALAVLCVLTAWWMMSAGRALSALVATRGRDVEHLMAAVAHLRRFFGLARIVIVVLALAVVAAGSLVVWCTLVVDRGGKCFGWFG